jgi:hypothetical protein
MTCHFTETACAYAADRPRFAPLVKMRDVTSECFRPAQSRVVYAFVTVSGLQNRRRGSHIKHGMMIDIS